MIDPLIGVEALKAMLGKPDLKLLDATWFMPGSGRDARADYAVAHLPSAVLFEIDAVADPASPLPHMLPTAQAFAAAAGRMGLSSNDQIVVYDRKPIPSAARVWWTLRAMGHDAIQVLDGGLEGWKDAGGAVEAGEAAPQPATFKAKLRPELVRDYDATLAALQQASAQLVDARPAPRFKGETPEPRAGLRSGHAPGARNTPSSSFFQADGRFLEPEALDGLFRAEGVDLARPVLATCGSGITAGVIALALARLGRWDTPVYDGSWADWGARPDAPVALGATDA